MVWSTELNSRSEDLSISPNVHTLCLPLQAIAAASPKIWNSPAAIGVAETTIEFTLPVALPVGVYQRTVAWASAALRTLFALTMTIALGMKALLGYGVFIVVGRTVLLAEQGTFGSS